jgi:hypothetical protein
MDMVRILRWIASLGSRGATSRACLVIDDTTAHVAVAPEQTSDLLNWFRMKGIGCEVWPAGAVCGLDWIDFGNPTPAQERQIHKAFAAWEKRK